MENQQIAELTAAMLELIDILHAVPFLVTESEASPTDDRLDELARRLQALQDAARSGRKD